MNKLYKEDEYCMDFSNEEIIEYLVKLVQVHDNINIKLSSDSEENISFDTKEPIRYISFDGAEENFYVSFCSNQTAVFILNEEFMFIDDYSKEHHTSSDTYGNVVYEGTLRDKTHKEILELIYELFTILLGAQKILIEETVVSQEGWQYPKCNYIIKLTNDYEIKKEVRFENILFSINA
jgi:hypothetical protein